MQDDICIKHSKKNRCSRMLLKMTFWSIDSGFFCHVYHKCHSKIKLCKQSKHLSMFGKKNQHFWIDLPFFYCSSELAQAQGSEQTCPCPLPLFPFYWINIVSSGEREIGVVSMKYVEKVTDGHYRGRATWQRKDHESHLQTSIFPTSKGARFPFLFDAKQYIIFSADIQLVYFTVSVL